MSLIHDSSVQLKPIGEFMAYLPHMELKPELTSSIDMGRKDLKPGLDPTCAVKHLSRKHVVFSTKADGRVYVRSVARQPGLVYLNGAAIPLETDVALAPDDEITLLPPSHTNAPNPITFGYVVLSATTPAAKATEGEDTDAKGSELEATAAAVEAAAATDTATAPAAAATKDATAEKEQLQHVQGEALQEAEAEAEAEAVRASERGKEMDLYQGQVEKKETTAERRFYEMSVSVIAGAVEAEGSDENGEEREEEEKGEGKGEKEEEVLTLTLTRGKAVPACLPTPPPPAAAAAAAALSSSTASRKRKKNKSDSLECAICLEYLALTHTTPCTHSFCYMCLLDIWEARTDTGGAGNRDRGGAGSANCPQCKSAFQLQQCVHSRIVDDIISNHLSRDAADTQDDATNEEHQEWTERMLEAQAAKKGRSALEEQQRADVEEAAATAAAGGRSGGRTGVVKKAAKREARSAQAQAIHSFNPFNHHGGSGSVMHSIVNQPQNRFLKAAPGTGTGTAMGRGGGGGGGGGGGSVPPEARRALRDIGIDLGAGEGFDNPVGVFYQSQAAQVCAHAKAAPQPVDLTISSVGIGTAAGSSSSGRTSASASDGASSSFVAAADTRKRNRTATRLLPAGVGLITGLPRPAGPVTTGASGSTAQGAGASSRSAPVVFDLTE